MKRQKVKNDRQIRRREKSILKIKEIAWKKGKNFKS